MFLFPWEYPSILYSSALNLAVAIWAQILLTSWEPIKILAKNHEVLDVTVNRIQFSWLPAFMAWSNVSVTISLLSCPIFKSPSLAPGSFPPRLLATAWDALLLSPSSGLLLKICPTTYIASPLFFASPSKYSHMLLCAVNQRWTCCTGESEQTYLTSAEGGHTGRELGSCRQWLSVIFLITWPLFHPEVCLSTCAAQDFFHAMLPNPFLILCATLQFLYFLRSVHHCLILRCCSHPGSELRDAADCSHLISSCSAPHNPSSYLELVLFSSSNSSNEW